MPGTTELRAMASGLPGMPARFTWRGSEYAVAVVVRAWKGYSPEGGRDGGKTYLRRHWFEVTTESGERMTLYCERQARNPKRAKSRWWLYTIAESSSPPNGSDKHAC